MYRPTYELRSFEYISLDEKLKVLALMLEALVAANCFFLQKFPDTPGIYDAGVPYTTEPPGRDNWQDIPQNLFLMEGDCEDLATWRVAELRVRFNEPGAKCDVMARVNGKYTLFHIRVRRQDGTIEDPSKILGMK